MTCLGPLLGAGKEAEVFAFGTGRVLKLGKGATSKLSAFREAAALARLERLDLPTPRVVGVLEHDGRWGVVMSRVEGESFAEAMMRDEAVVPGYFAALAGLQTLIHSVSGEGFPSLKQRQAQNIRGAPQLPVPLRERLLACLAELAEGDRLCHGDFHPFNVLGPLEAPIVVDWLDASSGPPAADLCRTFVLFSPNRPDLAEAMLVASLAEAGMTRVEVLEWLPVVAAARLAEGVPEVDALLAMADRV